MDILVRGDVEANGEGARFTSTFDLRPKGFVRLFAPMLGRGFERMHPENLGRLQAAIERRAGASDEARLVPSAR